MNWEPVSGFEPLACRFQVEGTSPVDQPASWQRRLEPCVSVRSVVDGCYLGFRHVPDA
jgi:hypothetical protein